ncbi:MAG TPA: hypothetical protein VHJ59_09725 [Nitrososphaera sp.]|jgi:hypothetical protein|nr:hypothetical protein [Nitrososphaera sp.]
MTTGAGEDRLGRYEWVEGEGYGKKLSSTIRSTGAMRVCMPKNDMA